MKEPEKPGKEPEAQKAPELPKVKIVKSYAGYDANAIIREASAQQKAKAREEKKARDQRTGQAKPALSKDGKGRPEDQKQGGRTFIARNPRAGEGQDKDRSGFRDRNERSQGQRPQGPRSAQPQASQAGAFDTHSGKNGTQRARSTYGNKDKDKKDKYRDEIQQPKKTGKGAFIKPEIAFRLARAGVPLIAWGEGENDRCRTLFLAVLNHLVEVPAEGIYHLIFAGVL